MPAMQAYDYAKPANLYRGTFPLSQTSTSNIISAHAGNASL
jgi:hypothetical protein